MDAATRVEGVSVEVFKQRGFRQRARNWYRTTSAGEYQVVNLQRSPWGSGSCYLNLGWDVDASSFRSENRCLLRLRAQETGVIEPTRLGRGDGVTGVEVPGIALLDEEVSSTMPEAAFAAEVRRAVVLPVADMLERTPSIVDLVPFLTAKPWFALRDARAELARRGQELPAG